MLVTESASCGVGATPVPESATGAVELPELLAKVMLPVMLPAALGANLMDAVTLAPGAMLSGRVRPESENSEPEITTPEMVSAAVPELETVKDLVEEAPVLTLPKMMLVVERARRG